MRILMIQEIEKFGIKIGHNGIREKYKRKGYGHMQLKEAIRRIKEYEGLQRII